LLVRIRDKQDARAWREFVGIYEPLIYRLARKNGFQHADAMELTQDVLLAVSKSIERWEIDPARGSFRGWLFRVARNLMINLLVKRRRHPQVVGAADFQRLVAEVADPAADESAEFDLEYRRSLFRWAAEQVRAEFKLPTWQAFWKTCVEGRAIREVSRELRLSTGAIYVARSRVMARLRACIEAVNNPENPPPRQEGASR
ncbi:MAG: RNA polymerase sigma factor, partial [Planctomycetes bacterium]|nr:RNA polymerase sigma factor [Planctomycetota bacterium]